MSIIHQRLPQAGGTNACGNPLWVLDDLSERSVIEADQHIDGGAVRIHQLLGRGLDHGTPHRPDAVEAAGLTLVAAADAARRTSTAAGTEVQPLSGPKNPAFVLGYNVLMTGLISQIEADHAKATDISTGREFCMECDGHWPCRTAQALSAFRRDVADLRDRGALV